MNPVRRKTVFFSRRQLLSLFGSLGFVLFAVRGKAHQLDEQPIEQPIQTSDKAFINRAFAMRDHAVAIGDQAYGAIVVKDGRIIGQSWSRVIIDEDPTGHAEMSALRDAARRNGRASLAGAVLYSSSRPCSMCEAAAAWVGISTMIHGQNALNAGKPNNCG